MSLRALIAYVALLAPFAVACGGNGAPSGSSQATETSSVAALVFYDENGDGALGSDERVRLPAVQVMAGTQVGTSDVNGVVSFSRVPAGVQSLSIQIASLPPYFQAGSPFAVTLPLAAGAVVPMPVSLAIGSNRPNRYLTFGDSITSGVGSQGGVGWTTPLERRLQSRWGAAKVIGDGIPGSRSIDGVARLPATLAREQPAFTLLLYGTNDWDRCQYLAADACYTIPSLRNMIHIVRDAGSLPIVGTIIPVNPDFPELGADNRNEWIRIENELIRQMVLEEGAVLADSGVAFGPDQSLWPGLFFDQLHPNDDGDARIADAFLQAITGSRRAH